METLTRSQKVGMSLFYTSLYSSKSIASLQAYFEGHLCSLLDIPAKARVEPEYLEPDLVCIPRGWDNKSKIMALREEFNGDEIFKNPFPKEGERLLMTAIDSYSKAIPLSATFSVIYFWLVNDVMVILSRA
jgi:hypothetical protein